MNKEFYRCVNEQFICQTISHVFMITVQVKNQLHITTKLTLNKEDFDHEYTCIKEQSCQKSMDRP